MNTQKILFISIKVMPGALIVALEFNKFLGFIRLEPLANEIAQTFLGTMFTTYLFKSVALTEIISGLLLKYDNFKDLTDFQNLSSL